MTSTLRLRPRLAALLGLVLIALGLLATGRLDSLPLVQPARHDYRAEFTDAGGLAVGDPVVVAGVRSGRVTSIEIEEQQVVVGFSLDAVVDLGRDTTATVASGDLLGAKEVEPGGDGSLPERTIDVKRTVPAFDVVAAFEGLTRTSAAIDTDQVAAALDTLATTFQDSPEEIRSALRGLSRFSATVASRDDDIRALLKRAADTTKVLDARRGDISSLLVATSELSEELIARKDAVHRLLVNTEELMTQLRGVIDDNEKSLEPALTHLAGVTRLLQDRDEALAASLRNLRSYGEYFVNVVGIGPWFDMFLPRIPDSVKVTAR